MKKKVLLLLVLFFSIITFTGCSINKKVITIDEFKTKMEGKGYTVSDAKEEFSDVSYITSAVKATKNDYEFYFFEIKDVDNAKNAYDNFKKELEDMDSKSSIEVNLGNHQKYEITTDSRYEFITRVDKTMMLVDVDKNYKDEMIDALKEIGYY